MFKKLFATVLGKVQGFPEGTASHLEALSKHVDGILGEPTQILHEKYSPDIHVDLIHYGPSNERDFHYVVTSGMSDRPMTSGGAPIDAPLMELAMALPARWDISAQGFKDPSMWAPLKLLKTLARYPHTHRTYFAKTHTVPLGDEPTLAPMVAALMMPPVLVSELRMPLRVGRDAEIHFLAPYLLQQNELDLKLNDGLDELLGGFGDRMVTELYDPQRASVLS